MMCLLQLIYARFTDTSLNNNKVLQTYVQDLKNFGTPRIW